MNSLHKRTGNLSIAYQGKYSEEQEIFMLVLYFVSTVGRDQAVTREYIREQEQEDKRLDQLNLWR